MACSTSTSGTARHWARTASWPERTMYTTLITVEQLKTLRDAKARLMVFDCTFDLMDPASGEKKYLESHIAGAVYANLDEALSDPGQPDASGHLQPHADAASGGR